MKKNILQFIGVTLLCLMMATKANSQISVDKPSDINMHSKQPTLYQFVANIDVDENQQANGRVNGHIFSRNNLKDFCDYLEIYTVVNQNIVISIYGNEIVELQPIINEKNTLVYKVIESKLTFNYLYDVLQAYDYSKHF